MEGMDGEQASEPKCAADVGLNKLHRFLGIRVDMPTTQNHSLPSYLQVAS